LPNLTVAWQLELEDLIHCHIKGGVQYFFARLVRHLKRDDREVLHKDVVSFVKVLVLMPTSLSMERAKQDFLDHMSGTTAPSLSTPRSSATRLAKKGDYIREVLGPRVGNLTTFLFDENSWSLLFAGLEWAILPYLRLFARACQYQFIA